MDHKKSLIKNVLKSIFLSEKSIKENRIFQKKKHIGKNIYIYIWVTNSIENEKSIGAHYQTFWIRPTFSELKPFENSKIQNLGAPKKIFGP